MALNVEADGVVVRLQRSEKRHGEIKHIVAYEGKKEVGRGPLALQNKLVVSSMGEGEVVLEEACAKICRKWDSRSR